MLTARHDPDRISITEAIALAQSAALGIAMILEGPDLWVSAPGAPVVIVYAFLMSITLFATARTSARPALALALAGATAGVAIVVPYLLRTELSAAGGAGLFTVASALATLIVGIVSHVHRVPLSQSTNPLARANTHCTEIRTASGRRAA